jgi:hypothetical protein
MTPGCLVPIPIAKWGAKQKNYSGNSKNSMQFGTAHYPPIIGADIHPLPPDSAN